MVFPDHEQSGNGGTFACRLKELRLRLDGKQLWLSREIGCTDAALSSWENGRRFPRGDMVSRIVDAFRKIGAPASETASLLACWRKGRGRRFGGKSRSANG